MFPLRRRVPRARHAQARADAADAIARAHDAERALAQARGEVRARAETVDGNQNAVAWCEAAATRAAEDARRRVEGLEAEKAKLDELAREAAQQLAGAERARDAALARAPELERAADAHKQSADESRRHCAALEAELAKLRELLSNERAHAARDQAARTADGDRASALAAEVGSRRRRASLSPPRGRGRRRG